MWGSTPGNAAAQSRTHRSRRRFLKGGLALAGIGMLSGCGITSAPSVARVARIGVLTLGGRSAPGGIVENLLSGLHEVGYVEGQDFTLDGRYAEGDSGRLPDLAADLVHQAPDVIVAAGTLAIEAAQRATSTIPIVMSNRGDPLGAHLIDSLAHPGGNLTGVSSMSVQLTGKRLELLAETVPGMSRVAAIWDVTDDSMTAEYSESRLAGQVLGIDVQPISVRAAPDLDRAYEAAIQARVDGVLVISDPIIEVGRGKLVDLAGRHQLPTMSSDPVFATTGGLMAYGPNASDQQRHTAYFVEKILKGAKPADLPVEQPTQFAFVINLRSAQGLGLTIPQSVLQQATEVIQ